jgi:hypothetical protein
MTEKRQTSHGYIIRILQHFATKLWNITNSVMLFQRLQISLIVFEKLTRACSFQILPIHITILIQSTHTYLPRNNWEQEWPAQIDF